MKTGFRSATAANIHERIRNCLLTRWRCHPRHVCWLNSIPAESGQLVQVNFAWNIADCSRPLRGIELMSLRLHNSHSPENSRFDIQTAAAAKARCVIIKSLRNLKSTCAHYKRHIVVGVLCRSRAEMANSWSSDNLFSYFSILIAWAPSLVATLDMDIKPFLQWAMGSLSRRYNLQVCMLMKLFFTELNLIQSSKVAPSIFTFIHVLFCCMQILSSLCDRFSCSSSIDDVKCVTQ